MKKLFIPVLALLVTAGVNAQTSTPSAKKTTHKATTSQSKTKPASATSKAASADSSKAKTATAATHKKPMKHLKSHS